MDLPETSCNIVFILTLHVHTFNKINFLFSKVNLGPLVISNELHSKENEQ